MKKLGWTLSLLLILVFYGCVLPSRYVEQLTQVSTIDALLAGVYDGSMTLRELKRCGSFGIGTFDRLDGEMVMLDGVVYQVKADGKVYRPDDSVTTPFAAVTYFSPQQECRTATILDFAGLCELIDELLPDRNGFVAILVEADFTAALTRSVPAQAKPYRPLAEVTRSQPEFALAGVRGQIIGFRLPSYVKGINVPGYHLHFLSLDRQSGGHVLALQMQPGALIRLAQLHTFHLVLPRDNAQFSATDLSRDRATELRQVEGAETRR